MDDLDPDGARLGGHRARGSSQHTSVTASAKPSDELGCVLRRATLKQASGCSGTACVSRVEYSKVALQLDKLQDENERLQEKCEELEEEVRSLRAQLQQSAAGRRASAARRYSATASDGR